MQQSNVMVDIQPVLTARKAKVAAAPRRQLAPAGPCAMVIFGAGGDLTKRLVVPALYNLAHTKMLPENFALIGVDHGQRTAENWRDHLYEALKGFRPSTAALSPALRALREATCPAHGIR
jgi:glucose-6-phosphate 1-dehydrogenase